MYPGRYLSLPSPFVSCPPYMSGLSFYSFPSSAAPLETSPIVACFRPPFSPAFPYLRFDRPFVDPSPPYFSVYPLSCMGGGRWCTVPGIVSLHNVFLPYITHIAMSYRSTVPVFAAGSSLWTLWYFWMSGVHRCLVPLSALLLSPHIIFGSVCQFIGSIFVTFLPRCKTGYFWHRGGFRPHNVLPIRFSDARFFCAVLCEYWCTPALHKSGGDEWRLSLEVSDAQVLKT